MNRRKAIYPLILVVLFSLLVFSATAQTAGSCKNSCGGKSKTSECYCDNVCSSYGDCCADYKEVCKTTQPPKPCAIPDCAAPPQGCNWKPGKDENGCMTCGKLICSECSKDSDCPQLECIQSPCPVNKCLNGKCVLTDKESVCGNGLCEKGEADECPSCVYANPPCKVACQQGTCLQDCGKVCPSIYKPVCGMNEITYSNSCEAENAGVKVQCENGCPCKQITKQDVIKWINTNCKDNIVYSESSGTPTSVTGNVAAKIFNDGKIYWKD